MNKNGISVVRGLNLDFIRDLITGSNGHSYVDIIESVFNTDQDDDWAKDITRNSVVSASKDGSLLYVIQLCLTPLSLHPGYCNTKVSHFDISQYNVYHTAARQPVFVGKWKQDINVCWLLHNVNFFKYQIKADCEGLLAHAYKDLEHDQFPQPWVGKINEGTQVIGGHWKGMYSESLSVPYRTLLTIAVAYMTDSELYDLRHQLSGEDSIHVDSLDAGEIFQVGTQGFTP